MRKYFLFLLLYCTPVFAQTFTLSGYITDASTGETLIGANVQITGTYQGAATDGNGLFRITGVKPGKHVLKISYMGYTTKEIAVNVETKSLFLKSIGLQPSVVDMQEIEVTAQQSEIADVSIESSHLELKPRIIEKITTSREDVFRAIKYLPGIQGIDPFSPLFSARGSDPGENLVLLDGVTIYNPYHFITGSGLFNLYAIKNIELLVGGFGAEYGGRNSSVLYITTREGNNKTLHGELETTTSHSRFIVDFPLNKNATMMISGRSYYDLVSRFLFSSPSYFFDGNMAVNWKISPRNRLLVRYFGARDKFDYSFARFSSYFSTTFETDLFDDYDLIMNNTWTNQAVTAIWKSVITPQIYFQTQVSGSFFNSSNNTTLDLEYTDEEDDLNIKVYYSTFIKNKIQDISTKSTLNVKLNEYNTLNTGFEFSNYSFENGFKINYIDLGTSKRQPTIKAAFVENKFQLGLLSVRPGVRYSKYKFSEKWYTEPRINGVLYLPYDLKIKAAWGKYLQYIVSINSQEYEISQFLENYYPLKNTKPSASTHYILGFEKPITPSSHLSVDFYYKDLTHLYTYDPTLSVYETQQFSDNLKQGTGKAYGVEILWKGTWRRFSGWLSYGISRSTRSFPHIMNGKSWPYDYDRTHSLKAVCTQQIHPDVGISGTLQIMSGVPRTLERSSYTYYYYDPQTGELATQNTYLADVKNNIRLPFYLRLDLGLQKRIRKGFAAELAEFLGADESFLNVRFGNILFLRRNVWMYVPMEEQKFYAIGSNYFPEFGVGYTIKF